MCNDWGKDDTIYNKPNVTPVPMVKNVTKLDTISDIPCMMLVKLPKYPRAVRLVGTSEERDLKYLAHA